MALLLYHTIIQKTIFSFPFCYAKLIKKELVSMDMNTLGYFIYMDEMEKQQKQQQEDSNDSGDEESD